MAHMMNKPLANRPPQYLFVTPTWFEQEAAGLKQPKHPGETMAEYRERRAKRWRAVKQGAVVLLLIALAVLAKGL